MASVSGFQPTSLQRTAVTKHLWTTQQLLNISGTPSTLNDGQVTQMLTDLGEIFKTSLLFICLLTS